jgi:hypothetical protein
MTEKPNPVHRKGDRNDFCPFYGDCLDFVVKNSWTDWDCSECPHKMREDARPEFQLTSRGTIPYYEVFLGN